MGLDLEQLLALPVYRAFDVDPDGRVLVGSNESDSMQLIEIAADGQVTELTALPGACTGRYIPGQRAVVVSHDQGGNENTQLSLLSLDEMRTEPAGLDDLTPLIHDSRYVHNVVFVQAGRIGFTTNRRNGVDFDLVMRDLATGEETVGYDGGKRISEAALSPDGRWLVMTAPGLPAMSDQVLLVDMHERRIDPNERQIDGQTVRELTGADEHTSCATPTWLPDGSAFVVTANRDRDFTGVARVDVATGRWDWLVTDDAHDLSGLLSPDGQLILVETNDDGASRLALHDATTGVHVRDVSLPVVASTSDNPLPDPRWSPDSRSIVASISSELMPGDALRIDATTGESTVLSHSARPLGDVRLVAPEAHRISTADGEQIPCMVFRPATDADTALAGASVVFIHGGPEGQSKRNYNPFVQALAQAGYTVIVPNVRGSFGYGKRWYSLDDVRLRLDSVADLAAIHAHLPALGLEQSRAALWGGSYGGYMVLAGVAFQPQLWAAGVDIVGISSLVTFLENTAPYRRSIREREYGSLEHDHDFLVAASPLTRIDDIRAPLFVIHGANDPRVPVSEAHQLHAALSANGVECELLVYGDEGHGLAKRANRLDAYPKAFAFLARHLS